MPIIINIFLLCVSTVIGKLYPEAMIYYVRQGISQIETLSVGLLRFYALLNTICLLLVVYNLYKIFGKSNELWICLLTLSAGFASRMVMSFSPTMLASGERTYIYLMFSIIIVCVMMILKLLDKMSIKKKKIIPHF